MPREVSAYVKRVPGLPAAMWAQLLVDHHLALVGGEERRGGLEDEGQRLVRRDHPARIRRGESERAHGPIPVADDGTEMLAPSRLPATGSLLNALVAQLPRC